jgi:hypothetical protein
MHRLLFIMLFTASCTQQTNRPISFYYWKTSFHLNNYEQQTLADNGVQALYVRYCDVDLEPGATSPKPIATITFDTTAQAYNIIPVVFIKNRTFIKTDSTAVTALADSVLKLVSQINSSQKINPPEIQFDCDWSESTKENYFLFINHYRAISKQRISCTIRLHQVKYPGTTGIPPVDRGVLMYYNMGSINAGPQRSIYEKSIAAKYNSFMSAYPLPLDVALPIFSWGLKIRNGRVTELLNKIYFRHFENDSNFRYVNKNWFTAVHPCFKAGYYFAQGDAVKIEQVSANDLLEMADDINRNSNKNINNIIFYDLDSANLVQYEKNLYKKVVDRFN